MEINYVLKNTHIKEGSVYFIQTQTAPLFRIEPALQATEYIPP